LSKDFNGSPEHSDAELVGEVRRGSPSAFEALVRRHLRAAHGLAISIVGDADEADDICQEGFILALKRIEQLREPGLFRSWLLAIVRNRALNGKAGQVRRGGPSVEEVMIPSGAPGSDAAVEWNELLREVQRTAEGLTEMQKNVFLLHDVEGMDHGEIAESLGISRGSSRVHLHMARRAVQSRLNGYSLEDV
jgi:RNA polymerase sigma-70 factor (ECF subfamily)